MKPILLILALAACDPITRTAMNSVDGIPSESSCAPNSQACVTSAAGVYPATCSGRGRLWPNLSLRADGTQRVCSDAGCAVDDAGHAGCL